jgi:hypothetical protein
MDLENAVFARPNPRSQVLSSPPRDRRFSHRWPCCTSSRNTHHHTESQAYTHTHINARTHTSAHRYVYTHIRTHAYTHTHTHTHNSQPSMSKSGPNDGKYFALNRCVFLVCLRVCTVSTCSHVIECNSLRSSACGFDADKCPSLMLLLSGKM